MDPTETPSRAASPLGVRQGTVGAIVLSVLLLGLPMVGLDAPAWTVALLYVTGLLALAGQVVRRDGFQWPPAAFLIPLTWITVAVLSTGGSGSPYVFAYGLAVLLVATFESRQSLVVVALAAAVAIAALRHWVPGPDMLPLPLLVAGGAVTLFAAVVINHVISAYRASRLEASSLRAVVDELVQPVTVYDSGNDRYLYVNEAAATMVGTRPEDMVGQPVSVIAEVRDRAEEQGLSVASAVAAAGGVLRQDMSLPLPDGDLRHLSIMMQAIEGAGRTMVVSVANDVTSLQRAYDAERLASDRLRDLDGMKNAFVSAVSHELRTPLTVVKGLASTIVEHHRQLTSAQVEDMATRIDAQASRLNDVLEDLFDVDRLAHGRLEPARGLIDPTSVVEATVAQRHIQAGVRLESKVASARVDPMMLERIVDNLLTNAMKYADGVIDVTLRSLPGDGVHVVVADRGPGIPTGSKEAVFEPFLRLDARHPSPGTGVGLALVANFAGLHGGRAWMDDRAGGGAEAHVLLPGPDAAPVSGPASIGDRRRTGRAHLPV